MSTSAMSHQPGRVRRIDWHAATVIRGLLLAGVVAVVLYGLGDLVSGLTYDGYSFRDQAISELTAFGSPVRPLMVGVMLIHAVLVAALGLGVWLSDERPVVHWMGSCLIAAGLVGLPTHTVFAMSSRGMDTGFNDTMHITLSVVFSLLVFAAMILAAVAYRGWFRWYSLATLTVLIAFGAAASMAMNGIDENDTPWAGGFERINAYAYFVWLVALALVLLYHQHSVSQGPER